MSGTIDGDRTRVADSPATSAKDEVRKRAVLATAAVVTVGLVVGGLYWLRPAPKPPVKTQAPIAMTSRFEPAQDAPQPKAPPPITITPQAASAPLPLPPPVDTLLDSARRAPVTAFSRKSVLETPTAQLALADTIEAEDKGAFERRFEPPKFKGARAGLLGDRRFIIAQGTSIPCVLETALQSDQPGFCSCVIARDVLSDNGQVVLMEKGTQVIGQYRGGLAHGQQRLHVLWSRAKTPAGVVVDLGSAGTDELGRAGFGGMIDNHWWERFGSAFLLSVVGDASKAAVQSIQQQTGATVANTGNAGKDAAAIAVEQGAQIRPTLHKNQGEMVAISVARDLDFSSVYRLAPVDFGGADRSPTTAKVPYLSGGGNGGLK